VGAQSYECTSSAHQQRRSGKIGRPGGIKKRREKQSGIYNDKVKDFAISLSGKALQWFNNHYFFVFLAVDLGADRPWQGLRGWGWVGRYPYIPNTICRH
jgi:hypothetical protein